MNMQAIGRKISILRKEHDLTQVELADKLGVTFQAVSSWERGNSMPDIAKLPDISQVLGVSIDDLLGSTKAATVIKNVLTGQTTQTPDMEAVAEVAPILKPSQVENIITQSNSEVFDQNVEAIIDMADHLSSETLVRLLSVQLETGNLNSDFLVRVAHLLESEDLRELALKCEFLNSNSIAEIACHMESEDLREVALNCTFLEVRTIADIASHMESEHLRDVAVNHTFMDDRTIIDIACHMESEHLRDVAMSCKFIEDRTVVEIACHMESEDLREVVLNCKFLKPQNIASIACHMESEDLKPVAARFIEEHGLPAFTKSGILEHMEEEDIAEIMLSSL